MREKFDFGLKLSNKFLYSKRDDMKSLHIFSFHLIIILLYFNPKKEPKLITLGQNYLNTIYKANKLCLPVGGSTFIFYLVVNESKWWFIFLLKRLQIHISQSLTNFQGK